MTAARDLAGIGSAVNSANAAAANFTTLLPAVGADEVSTRVAALFGAHGVTFQAATARAAQLHERFVLNLAANANAYLTSEIANAEQSLWNAVSTLAPTLLGCRLIGDVAGASGAAFTGVPGGTTGGAPAGSASMPSPSAGTRITVPGAGPLYYPNFITELPYLGQVLYVGSAPGRNSVSILPTSPMGHWSACLPPEMW